MRNWQREGKKDAARRWTSIVGGLVVGALLVVLVASTGSVESFLFLGLDTLKRSVLVRLEDGIEPGLRDEVRRGFDCVIAAATERRITEESVGAFARACRGALEDRRVSESEARTLRDLAQQLCRAR